MRLTTLPSGVQGFSSRYTVPGAGDMATPTITPTPQFGRAMGAGPLLRNFDFTNFAATTVRQSMLIYALIISSRIVWARTNNERAEILRRDIPGWYTWFMGKPLLEYGIIQLITMNNKTLRGLLSKPAPPDPGILGKLYRTVNPISGMFQTTTLQLKQRQRQIVKAMAKQGLPLKRMRQVESMFRNASNVLMLTSFVSLILTVLALGIGIPQINVWITRANVEREKKRALGQLA
jgi:hypothetical protein